MDNNFNQQPQYQQPQYQQPQYQQPMYQPRPQGAGVAGIVDALVKFAPVVALIFVCLAGVGFLYDFIEGIVDASQYDFQFDIFLVGIRQGIACAANYIFYAVIVSFLAKILKK